jgi:hypothetical protein
LLNERSLEQLTDSLQHFVEQLDNDPSLVEPDQLRRRLEVLDRLDAYFPDTPETPSGAESIGHGLYRRARAIRARLEAVNGELYEGIRDDIRRGSRPDILLRWISSSPEIDNGIRSSSGMAYDYLDELISGVFQFEEPNDEQIPRDPEKVAYQPTPARHIFSLIRLTALTATDVLVDLGSGLGHVPLLVSTFTSASSIGIECEATYVERARQCAQRLKLKKVTFLHQDVRAGDLSAGTVFYLYTPFVGAILSCVLNLLRREAGTRRIRICTYGPCTSVVAEEPWLQATATPEADRIAVFRSRG